MGYTDDKTSEGARGGSTYAGRNFRVVGAPFIKKDAKAMVTGKPVFTDDLALKECLVVKAPMTGSYWTAGCVSRETRWQSWQERTRQRWIMPCASYV